MVVESDVLKAPGRSLSFPPSECAGYPSRAVSVVSRCQVCVRLRFFARSTVSGRAIARSCSSFRKTPRLAVRQTTWNARIATHITSLIRLEMWISANDRSSETRDKLCKNNAQVVDGEIVDLFWVEMRPESYRSRAHDQTARDTMREVRPQRNTPLSSLTDWWCSFERGSVFSFSMTS